MVGGTPKRAREPPREPSPLRDQRTMSSAEWQQYMAQRVVAKERWREFHRPPRSRPARTYPKREREQAERHDLADAAVARAAVIAAENAAAAVEPAAERTAAERAAAVPAAAVPAAAAPAAAAPAAVAPAAAAPAALLRWQPPASDAIDEWAWDDEWRCWYNVAEAEAVDAAEAHMASDAQAYLDQHEVRVARALSCACACVRVCA